MTLAQDSPADCAAVAIRVASVSEYVKVAGGLAAAAHTAWFRGICNYKYALAPGLFRLGNPSWTYDNFLDVEELLLERYAERSMPYRPGTAPDDELGFLFEMQHYGAPTRLLDWSENALLALWFALDGCHERRARVWVLDAANWNHCVLASRSDSQRVLSPTHTDLHALLQRKTPKRAQMLEAPLCLYGQYNSSRIVGQRGVFTLSGRSRTDMCQQAATLAVNRGLQTTQLLQAIDIPASCRRRLRDEMQDLGYTRSMIYPDLVGLAAELAERARADSL